MDKSTNSASVKILPLSQCPDFIPLCAAWCYGEWGCTLADRSLDYYLDMYRDYANDSGIPFANMAFVGDQPAGMAAIRDYDLAAPDNLKPWLTLVFVHPFFRGQGIATQLVQSIESHAAQEGWNELYLYSVYGEGLYKKLSWETFQTVDNPMADDTKKTAVLMKKSLSSLP